MNNKHWKYQSIKPYKSTQFGTVELNQSKMIKPEKSALILWLIEKLAIIAMVAIVVVYLIK